MRVRRVSQGREVEVKSPNQEPQVHPEVVLKETWHAPDAAMMHSHHVREVLEGGREPLRLEAAHAGLAESVALQRVAFRALLEIDGDRYGQARSLGPRHTGRRARVPGQVATTSIP